MGSSDQESDREGGDLSSCQMAIQIRSTRQQREVGIALSRTRLRSSCVKGQRDEDKKQWQFLVYEFADSSELSDLETVLVQNPPSKCYVAVESNSKEPLSGDAKKLQLLLKTHDIQLVSVKKKLFRDPNVETNLCRLLGISSIAAHKDELEKPLAMGALAALIESLDLMTDATLFGCFSLEAGNLSSAMQLDSSAIWSLNLLPEDSGRGSNVVGGSVMEILNRGKTLMGRRLLERWIRQPLVDIKQIRERQDLVNLFVDESSMRMELLDECMKSLPDFERLSVVLERKKHAKLDDMVSVYDAAIDCLPRILRLLQQYQGEQRQLMEEKFIDPIQKVASDLTGFVKLVEEVVDLDSRPTLVINAKHDEELQNLRDEWNNVLALIEDEHRNARETIGGDIKCEKDKVRGFVFRIINKKEEARISRLPYVHICQVLVNGVHFTTSKLKSLASEYRQLRAEYEKRQTHLLNAAIDVAGSYVPVLEGATRCLSELDVLLGFAHAACHAGSGYCRPVMDKNGDGISLGNARHPCVELQDHVDFIPNDYCFDRSKTRFQLITGPNMGGKSTYIRQLGAIAVMAQIGSFVPADEARLPIFDKLLVRVGAGDLQQRGVSTFMMEMLEASAILHKATSRSLVIIDELGRGTSTYDGFGLAWAISEYLLTKVKAMCLFATHFHELTALEQEYPQGGFCNKHVTALASQKQITMVYQVHPGPCMESFGVHVAEMADFPAKVLSCAKRKSEELESFEKAIGAHADAKSNVDAKRRRLEFVSQFAALPLDRALTSEVVPQIKALLANP